jgi:hypothetical protein
MKHTKINLVMAAAAVVGLFSMALAPVAMAHNGRDAVSGSRDDVATTTSSEDLSGSSKPDKAKVQERVLELKTKAKSNLAERRAGKEALTAERRQKVCEQRKVSINNKVTAFSKSADNILTRFDAVYTRVKDFKTEKKADVANYDELIAAADAKQAAATEAVAALKETSTEFDCTTTDPAQTLATIKAATVDARTALKEYRTSIKNIVVALAQVQKNSTDKQSTGDNTGDNTNDTTNPDATTTSPATTEEQ